ncbi:hypothetical protein [Jeotgalibacillus proteolyticus]|uniref:Uncharacterized protein n=1 Tax=Jeotgalibacillus proteolyticus TaxID=2082395 RepID=A0A2S5GAT4_9BACL|nr:hypothetical protein [Jeotgalibacillus proteolyticus]PPA70100.1 hypothetical protein C4B60_10945 [Jeotgalibacillus proteolyticus]
MNKMIVIPVLFLLSLMLAACNSESENGSDNEGESNPTGQKEETPVEVDEEDAGSQEDESEEANYTEENVKGDYIIYSERADELGLLYYFTRTAEDLPHQELLHRSLVESDTSLRNLFSAVTNFEVQGTAANFYYNEDDNLSMASTESEEFWEVLNELGFRFGIEEFNLLNQDGERGLTFAENYWEEPVKIEPEPNRGYYVVSAENSERGELTYVSAAVAGEEIYDDNGELLDFGQTVEAMAEVESGEPFYYAGIFEGMEIEEAIIEENQAIVRYRVNDGVQASEQERIDFEQVLQLTALDFQVQGLKIVNESDKIVSTYPLVETKNADMNADREQEESSKMTEDEAIEKVFNYLEAQEDVNLDDIQLMIQDTEGNENEFTVQAFVFSGEEEDEAQMTNTLGWYSVDKNTGEVEATDY